MNFYPETQIVEIIVPFTDPNGQTIVPAEITAILKDGEDQVLLDFGSVAFDGAGVEAKITVPAIANTLQGDELQEVRRLEVSILHTSGSFSVSRSYVIEAEQSLQIMRNSFMTYETAVMMSTQFVNMTAFVGATEERRRAALVEAYRRISDFPMIYSIVDAEDKVVSKTRISSSGWQFVTANVFQNDFPAHFKRALRSAQLVEADELLQGNVIARKHAQGISTETIGESSVTLRPGFAGATSANLSASALGILGGYIDRTIKIGRA